MYISNEKITVIRDQQNVLKFKNKINTLELMLNKN